MRIGRSAGGIGRVGRGGSGADRTIDACGLEALSAGRERPGARRQQ